MSDKDRPPNPFGRGDRTIIRPNPGGRLPPRAVAAPPSERIRAAAGGSPLRARSRRRLSADSHGTRAAVRWRRPARAAIGAAGTAPTPAARRTPASARRMDSSTQPPARRAAARADLRVDDLVAPNANPIMRAAGPLLLLLGRLRVALCARSFASLMEQVADAIKFFEKDIRSAGIPEQQANSAKYILCATADDIVQHIPTEDRHVWTQYSMLSRFFGERVGGVRFFESSTSLKLDPLINYPRARAAARLPRARLSGHAPQLAERPATLQQIQRNLYETLRRVRPKVRADLSPRWQGQKLAQPSHRACAFRSGWSHRWSARCCCGSTSRCLRF